MPHRGEPWAPEGILTGPSGASYFWGLPVTRRPLLRRPKTAAGPVLRKSPTMLWITQNTELSAFGDKHSVLENSRPNRLYDGHHFRLRVVYHAALRISRRAKRCKPTSFGFLHELP